MAHCKIAVALLFGLLVFAEAALCSGDHGQGHDGEKPGPNGGEVQEIGDADDTHVELIHDHANGKTTMFLLGKDIKTPVPIQDAPKINLKAKSGNKQVQMKAVNPAEDGSASRFEASDEEFKADPLDGLIVILLKGKQYRVKLDAHFGHKHQK